MGRERRKRGGGQKREGGEESVKVVRKSGYRNRLPVQRLQTGMMGTLSSTLLHIRISFGDSPLSPSFYSPFLRPLEVDDRRSMMIRGICNVPVSSTRIDPPSGSVRVLKQTRRSRRDPFIPTRTSTSFRTPSSSSFSSSSCSSCIHSCHTLPTYLPTLPSILHVARPRVFSLSGDMRASTVHISHTRQRY